MRALLLSALLVTAVHSGAAQTVRGFKTVGSDSLVMHIYMPPTPGTNRPAVVLFHGGAFVWGGPELHKADGERYPARGVVAFAVQYRLADRKSITPIEQVEDAMDAIRWVRAHAAEYGVDKNRVIAHGVSAGGYLSAMAAGSQDAAARPNAMVLWSPGLGDGTDAYFQGLLIGRAKGPDVAPNNRILDPMPPTVIISGALDSVTFDAEARSYCARLSQGGGRCEIHSYPNLGHLLSRRLDARSQQRGQFDWDEAASADALEKVWAFLRSLGYVAR